MTARAELPTLPDLHPHDTDRPSYGALLLENDRLRIRVAERERERDALRENRREAEDGTE